MTRLNYPPKLKCAAYYTVTASTDEGRAVAITEVKCQREAQAFPTEIYDNGGTLDEIYLCHKHRDEWRNNEPTSY